MDEFEVPMSHTYGGWKELCEAYKFHIQAKINLLWAKNIYLHKTKLLQDTSNYERAWRSQRYIELQISSIETIQVNHTVILLSNIYLAQVGFFSISVSR